MTPAGRVWTQEQLGGRVSVVGLRAQDLRRGFASPGWAGSSTRSALLLMEGLPSGFKSVQSSSGSHTLWKYPKMADPNMPPKHYHPSYKDP